MDSMVYIESASPFSIVMLQGGIFLFQLGNKAGCEPTEKAVKVTDVAIS